MGLGPSNILSNNFGFFHDEDIQFFAETALKRSKAAQLQRKMMKQEKKRIKKQKRTAPIPPLSEMVQTSEDEFENIKFVDLEEDSDATNPTTSHAGPTTDNEGISARGQPATSASRVLSSTRTAEPPTVYTVDSPQSTAVSKKASPIERMKEREEQRDFLAVTASSLKNRSEQRRLGSSRRSSRGHSPSSARSLTGSIPLTATSDNLVGIHLPEIDEKSLQAKLDAIRLETILDNEEEEYVQENNDNKVLNQTNNNVECDEDDSVFQAPVPVVDIQIEPSRSEPGMQPNASSTEVEFISKKQESNIDLKDKISSTSYTLENMRCNNQDSELTEGKTDSNGGSNNQSAAALDSELAPDVWSEVEIFALIEIPEREEPLRIEYHRFGSTLDFSTRPAMNPSFSSNMTHEEMSSLFEGDLDMDSKYGASQMLSLIPKLINKYEGFMIINGLEMRIIRTTRMELKDILVENHVVNMEVIPKAITEIELRRSPSRFEIEWRDEVAIHTTKWMTVAGQQEQVSQLKLTKSKADKSVLLLTIPL